MLRIIIEGKEGFNQKTQEFSKETDDVVIDLEHSLLSLSKWESEFQKPFLDKGNKTNEEMFGYLRCMIMTPGIDPNVLFELSNKNVAQIQRYINSPQSATTFGKLPERPGKGEIITAELIYYWMVAFNIPVEFESWHLNRLFALIKICNIKQQKPKKVSRSELAQRNHALNEARKAEYGTTG